MRLSFCFTALSYLLVTACSQTAIDLRTARPTSAVKSETSASNSDASTVEIPAKDTPPEGFKAGLIDGSPVKWDNQSYIAADTETYEAFVALEKLNGYSFSNECNSGKIPGLDGIPGPASFKRTIMLSNGELRRLSALYFGNNTCSGAASFLAGENFQITNPKKMSEGNFKIDIRYISHAILATSDAGANLLNGINLCNKNNWVKNVFHFDSRDSNRGGCSTEDGTNSIGAALQGLDIKVTANSFEAFGISFPDDHQKLDSNIIPATSAVDDALAIVGGSVITDENAALLKATVSLINGGNEFCSGTLIGPRYVVTAAHCIYQYDRGETAPGNIQVGFGTGLQTLDIVEAKIHENYRDSFLNNLEIDPIKQSLPLNEIYDIAVLKLAENAPSKFQPISILPSDVTIDQNAKIILAGWGVSADFSEGTDIRGTETKFNESSKTSKAFSIYSDIGTSSCSGDSGGPAYYVHEGWLYVIGATSYGPSFYQCISGDGVYVDLRYYTEWLSEAIK